MATLNAKTHSTEIEESIIGAVFDYFHQQGITITQDGVLDFSKEGKNLLSFAFFTDEEIVDLNSDVWNDGQLMTDVVFNKDADIVESVSFKINFIHSEMIEACLSVSETFPLNVSIQDFEDNYDEILTDSYKDFTIIKDAAISASI